MSFTPRQRSLIERLSRIADGDTDASPKAIGYMRTILAVERSGHGEIDWDALEAWTGGPLTRHEIEESTYP